MKIAYEKFGTKVFLAFTFFIFFISISFTAFYIHHQSKFLTDTLIKDGRLLAGILSYNSRIGVFSENKALLKDPVEGIFQYEGVLEVSIFNLAGELLKRREKSGTRSLEKSAHRSLRNKNKIFEKLKTSKSAFYFEYKDHFDFWSPVVSGSGYSIKESILFEAEPMPKEGRIIGFVRIKQDKAILKKEIHNLLFKSIVIGIVFLMMGSAISFFVISGITKPLKRLTEEVNVLGRGGAVEKVSVETEDEIGKLAMAFNNMSESLKKRENTLKESELRLRVLSSRLLNAQEQERKRVSKELHDELGQALALLKHQVRSIQSKLLADQSSISRECERTIRYIDLTLQNVRRLSMDLRPAILEHLGLSAALRWLINNFKKQHSIQTSIAMENLNLFFSPEAQTNLYRIFQEALTNIGKHAQAGRVFFTMKKEAGCVTLRMEDDGIGFSVNETMVMNSAEGGMGLAAMKERANMLGARLDIASQTGKGTTITLNVPTKKETTKW